MNDILLSWGSNGSRFRVIRDAEAMYGQAMQPDGSWKACSLEEADIDAGFHASLVMIERLRMSFTKGLCNVN